MKVLVIGSGGREHALAWRIAQSAQVETVFVAPGNGGTTGHKLQRFPYKTLEDLCQFAQQESIDLTVVGPEAPLAQGVVDLFRQHQLPIFGPTQAAAQLESSKDFAKAFMVRHHIPTAAYATFDDTQAALAYLADHPAPIVIKADGLAAGKGVIVAMTDYEAQQAVQQLCVPGGKVVIEDFLDGEEASFMVMCDGQTILPLATSQDHKRLLDHDQGPNTGGMGAYSPAPVVSEVLHQRIMKDIIEPTIAGMQADGIPFTGFLYAGLMIGPGDDQTRSIKVLEYNCRMGDPETQPIMMRIESDFAQTLLEAATGQLNQSQIQWSKQFALGVVLAAENYPGTPVTGVAIHHIPPQTPNSMVFHAGTAQKDGQLVSSGGRVLCVTALGTDIAQARQTAYELVSQIDFPRCQYRHDIAWRALKS